MAQLQRDPGATAPDLKKALKKFDTRLDLEAFPVGQDLLLIAPRYGSIGTAFLVQRHNPRILWTVIQAAKDDADHRQQLAGWLPTANPPLFLMGGGNLPPDGNGNPRFYIAAQFSQEMGATQGRQVSIWSWNGKTATPALIHRFPITIGQGMFERAKDDLLIAREKHEYRSATSCGSCNGRQMDHTWRLEAGNIRDLGLKSLAPEFDAVDDLFDRLLHNRPTDAIAAPEVAQRLGGEIAKLKSDKTINPEFFHIGMLGEAGLKRGPDSTIVCWGSDDYASVLLTLEPRHGRFFISRTDAPGDKSAVCGQKHWISGF